MKVRGRLLDGGRPNMLLPQARWRRRRSPRPTMGPMDPQEGVFWRGPRRAILCSFRFTQRFSPLASPGPDCFASPADFKLASPPLIRFAEPFPLTGALVTYGKQTTTRLQPIP